MGLSPHENVVFDSWPEDGRAKYLKMKIVTIVSRIFTLIYLMYGALEQHTVVL
jgi:hypothetical protein